MSNCDKKRKEDSDNDSSNKKIKASKLTDEIKNKIDKINKVKQNMYNEIYENIRRNNCLRDEINKLDKELYNICPHNWVRDYDQFSYDSTPKICEYCGL